MDSSIVYWADEDIFSQFDVLLSNGIIIDKEKKKELLSKLFKSNPDFFNDKFNIIYLKLINLYSKIVKKNGENSELYYITDRFLPNNNELLIITKQLRVAMKDLNFRTFIENNFDYTSILLPYKEALKYASDLSQTDKSDNLSEAIEILNHFLTLYEKDNYVYDMIEDNRSEKFNSKVEELDIETLASIYCEINGNDFTDEEKKILSSELSELQKNTLETATNVGRKK